MVKFKSNPNRQNRAWIIPVILIAILILSVGGYYAFSKIDLNNPAESSETTTETIPTTTEDPELTAMKQALDRDVFYDGIWIGDLDLSGKTEEQARKLLQDQEKAAADAFALTLSLDKKTWSMTAAEAGFQSDWQEVLDKAWQTGRSGESADDAALIRERYAAVEKLKKTPLHLELTNTWDENLIRQKLDAIAKEVNIEPLGARATGFNTETKKFTIEEQVTGYQLQMDACLSSILDQLKAGQYKSAITLKADTVKAGMDAKALGANLGLVSEARTSAKKVNKPRDNNITLICKMLNGLVLQPGEQFSFNGRIGERTAEKGFQEAGGIMDGVLVPTVGGGICQPNTTLCHAVLMADLQIDARRPHSWPSDYVAVGLDATVSWPNTDFKFTNNTDYPLAIVAWYKKPAIVFQIYGRQLDQGVSIKLTSEILESTPPGDPQVTVVPTMAPGTTNEIRSAHNAIKAIAYKDWYKDGQLIKREVAFKSSYRPLVAIYEVGPTPTPGAPTPAATEPAPTTEQTTAAPTEAPTETTLVG
ncbi:MAG: VanW family protein [Clostridiaceae bacterium]|nr:VanW family protein [Clostridiaceae bacterium]